MTSIQPTLRPTAGTRPVPAATPTAAAPVAEEPKPTPPAVNVNVTVGGADDGNQFHEFLVMLDDQATRKVEKAFDMPMGDKRRGYVAKTLIDTMMKTQQPLWDVLEGLQAAGHVDPKAGFQPLWIENAIVVHGDDEAETVMAHAAGVAQAVKSATHVLDKRSFESESLGSGSDAPSDSSLAVADPEASGMPANGKAAKGLLWNVNRMGAPKAWAQGITGKGVTVGIVDTGVDVNHPNVLAKYRGYVNTLGEASDTANWYDATGKSTEPVDDEGHGTHVTGTILGGYGSAKTGMAPDAKFIAARGLGEDGGTDGMLLRSMQYMVGPRVPDPGTSVGSKRDLTLGVDVINNSWGSNDGLSTAYMNALRNMAAMGVINVFAAGNDGQGGKPGSVGSPASSPYIVTVAATDRKDKVAEFSSRGPNPLPSPNGDPTPYVAAPGVDIFSSVPGGKFEHGWDGTSMATPAVTGVITLVQQAAQQVTGSMFDVNAMKDVLKRIAQDVDIKGVDDNTGYGIPAIPDNLKDVVKQVAVDRGLMKADAPADATVHQPARVHRVKKDS